MTTFPGSPRLVKGGLVLIESDTSSVQRTIALQYNPETLTRTLQVQAAGEGGDRSEALRLKGPPTETIRLEAVIDATDQLEFPERYRAAVEVGIHPQLAALETLLYPSSTQLITNDQLARAGRLEIIPMETSLLLFVWGAHRVVPVRLTDFSVTEEAFDPSLNPIRARVSLTLRVLSVDDLGFAHAGGDLFMSYLVQKETLATRAPGAALGALGIGGGP